MAAKLWGTVVSPNYQRVLVVALELQVPVEEKFVNLLTGEHKKPEFVAKHPLGEVPLWEGADNLVVFESRAITRYLAVLKGHFLPIADPAKYAVVESWINVEQSNFQVNAGGIAWETFYKNYRGLQADLAAVEAYKGKLNSLLAAYEKQLEKHEYLAGNEVTLADLHHLPIGTIVFGHLLPTLLDGFPHVKAWFGKLSARPTWKIVQEHVAKELANMAKK